jgi:hypothetical protein
MVIIDACRDFIQGLARGFSLFLTERHDGELSYTMPEAVLTSCLHPRRPGEDRKGEGDETQHRQHGLKEQPSLFRNASHQNPLSIRAAQQRQECLLSYLRKKVKSENQAAGAVTLS